jgi:hypothetical protein
MSTMKFTCLVLVLLSVNSLSMTTDNELSSNAYLRSEKIKPMDKILLGGTQEASIQEFGESLEYLIQLLGSDECHVTQQVVSGIMYKYECCFESTLKTSKENSGTLSNCVSGSFYSVNTNKPKSITDYEFDNALTSDYDNSLDYSLNSGL